MWREYFNAFIDRYKKRTELLTCKHEWNELKTFNEYRKDSTIISSTKVTYVCKVCGKFEQILL